MEAMGTPRKGLNFGKRLGPRPNLKRRGAMHMTKGPRAKRPYQRQKRENKHSHEGKEEKIMEKKLLWEGCGHI